MPVKNSGCQTNPHQECPNDQLLHSNNIVQFGYQHFFSLLQGLSLTKRAYNYVTPYVTVIIIGKCFVKGLRILLFILGKGHF